MTTPPRTLALALMLATSAGQAAYPAPDPVTIPVDQNLKFAAGTIASLDEAQHLMVVKCPSGLVTFHIDRVAVMGFDRTPRALSGLVGQLVNIWYHVDNGAIAAEIDLARPQS